MQIYILRHAIASPPEGKRYPNDDRPLTKEGRLKMNIAATGIAKIVDRFNVILTSPLVRAHDTAGIVAKAMKHKKKLETCEYLLPGNSPYDVLNYLVKFDSLKSILLVGHEPDLGRLASALLGSNKPIIEMKKGALCRIDVDRLSKRTSGKLMWHLNPKHLRALAK